MSSVNLFKFRTADNSVDDLDVHAGGCPIAGINMHLNKKIVKFGAAITDDVPFEAKQSESMIVQSSFLLDMCMDTQAKKRTKIFAKVKSAKDNFTKLLKTTGRVSPALSKLGPFFIPRARQHGVQDVHPSPLLTSGSQYPILRVRVVTVLDSLPSVHTRLEAITSFVTYSEHAAEGHMDDSLSILRCVAEASSPSSPAQLLIVPESPHILPSTFLRKKLHKIEEEVEKPEVNVGGVHMEPKKLTVSSPCGSLTTSDSEAKYDEMLAAEFSTFSFDSNDVQEWTDEVERENEAKMDAHFVYVSEALAVPVPKLSAYFASDSPAEFASDPSPVKTVASETSTSADSSLVTVVDAEEDRTQLSPIILSRLRRIRSHEDLRNLQVITDCSDSFSDLSLWSFDLGPSDSTAGGKTGIAQVREV